MDISVAHSTWTTNSKTCIYLYFFQDHLHDIEMNFGTRIHIHVSVTFMQSDSEVRLRKTIKADNRNKTTRNWSNCDTSLDTIWQQRKNTNKPSLIMFLSMVADASRMRRELTFFFLLFFVYLHSATVTYCKTLVSALRSHLAHSGEPISL